jgi:hypothetical protein
MAEKKPAILDWEEFQSVKNNQQGLMLKAKALAPWLIDIASANADALITIVLKPKFKDRKEEKNSHLLVQIDFILICIHWCDRVLSWHFEENLRFIFFDALIVEIEHMLCKKVWDKKEKVAVRRDFERMLNSFQEEYANYNMFSEPLRDYILWRFGFRVLEHLRMKEDVNRAIHVRGPVLFAFEQLNFAGLLGLQMPAETCINCSASLVQSAKFCNQCGQKVTAAN